MTEPIVRSAYWDNMNSRIVTSQAKVFAELGIPLVQENTTGEHHGDWMTRIANSCDDEILLFCDIDAFPLTRAAYEKAVALAKNGMLFGMAQTANHIDPDMIYAAPSFLAVSQETYDALGRPSLAHSETFDPAQQLTTKAQEIGVPIQLSYPGTFILPKWPLADVGVYGIGTFYGDNEFFHLFQARFAAHIEIFEAVSEDVVAGHLKFGRYLELAKIPLEPIKSKKFRGLRKLFRRARNRVLGRSN